jgi:DNA-binding GntR family transcriptional regulator
MLERIRLVDKTPKGSYQVTELTPELILSLYDTAIVLYQYAFSKAAENATDKDLSDMERALIEIEKSIEGKDFELYLTNVTRLAKVILKTAGNPIIERLALELMPSAERVQWASITTLPGQLKAIVEHLRRGYEFIASKNPEKAAMAFNDFATTHINIVLNTIRESMDQNLPEQLNSAAR